MVRRRLLVLGLFAILVFVCLPILETHAQLVNGDFETGDFTGWTTGGTTAIVTPGTDPRVPISTVHQGSFAARIGDDVETCPVGGPVWSSSISQTVTIPPPPDTSLNFWYAVGAEGSHEQGEASGFTLTVTAGPTTVYQANNEAYDEPSASPGWKWQGDGDAYYDWTQVSVDLSAYEGQLLTVTFEVNDCIFTGHAAWGYLDGIEVSRPPAPRSTNPYVGGELFTANKVAVVAPYLIGILSVAAVAAVVVKKKLT